MREPQVVRQLRVQKLSLCAMGIPVSVVPSPLAMRASAAAAWARLLSGSKVMKALSRSFVRCARCTNMRVSSTLDTRLPCNAEDSSTRVALIIAAKRAAARSLDDLGDELKTVLDLRGIGLEALALIVLGDPIFAKPKHDILGMRHGCDARGVHRPHLFDQREDVVQLMQHLCDFLRIDFDARQRRDMPDVVDRQCHGMTRSTETEREWGG